MSRKGLQDAAAIAGDLVEPGQQFVAELLERGVGDGVAEFDPPIQPFAINLDPVVGAGSRNLQFR